LNDSDKYLTDEEAGRVLRRSAAFVRRLRLRGELPYIPGRPVYVDRADLEDYISGAKIGEPVPKPEPPPTAAELERLREEADEAARQCVLRKKAQAPRRRRATSTQGVAPGVGVPRRDTPKR